MARCPLFVPVCLPVLHFAPQDLEK